ncbi:hypothetical protein BIWAKO_00451 [Bosea sp. BIWAKO-01]|nr:hypothetical protein BIWAKO_00451 [Bosea sp. BIWAKO-01]
MPKDLQATLSDDDVVIETTETDPEGRFVAEIDWFECPDDVEPG